MTDQVPAHLRASVSAAASSAIARLSEELPWYELLSAEQRSEIEVLAASGVASFFRWYENPSTTVTAESLLAQVPQALVRTISLQEALALIRTVVDAVEQDAPSLVPEGEADTLRVAALRFSTDFAFSIAKVYARVAEQRGAWDARLEATVVDALLRDSTDPGILSRISALGWRGSSNVLGIVVDLGAGEGAQQDDSAVPLSTSSGVQEATNDRLRAGSSVQAVTDQVRYLARQASVDVLLGVQGNRLVIVVGMPSTDRLLSTMESLMTTLGTSRAAVGPTVTDVLEAGRSLRAAIMALEVAPAWPNCSRIVRADDLLPERAIAGDPDARRILVESIYDPLRTAHTPLLHTLDAYWDAGLAIEATARALFVHTNTVRYRLQRVTELIGWDPTDPREGFIVRIGVTMGRLPQHDESAPLRLRRC